MANILTEILLLLTVVKNDVKYNLENIKERSTCRNSKYEV